MNRVSRSQNKTLWYKEPSSSYWFIKSVTPIKPPYTVIRKYCDFRGFDLFAAIFCFVTLLIFVDFVIWIYNLFSIDCLEGSLHLNTPLLKSINAIISYHSGTVCNITTALYTDNLIILIFDVNWTST